MSTDDVMKEEKKKRKWLLILGILLLILLVGGMFFYFATASPNKPRAGTEIENPIADKSEEEALLYFREEYIDYLVFAIGGWKLHNPPLSDETPKVKVIADDEVFVSEIIKGEIKTEKASEFKRTGLTSEKEIENEDITIKTTKEEIVRSMMSSDMKNYIKSSIQEGKTNLELKASYTTLFSKGYLAIYKDITGKSFTGSVARIFAQG